LAVRQVEDLLNFLQFKFHRRGVARSDFGGDVAPDLKRLFACSALAEHKHAVSVAVDDLEDKD
jgi:hypothetical protein